MKDDSAPKDEPDRKPKKLDTSQDTRNHDRASKSWTERAERSDRFSRDHKDKPKKP